MSGVGIRPLGWHCMEDDGLRRVTQSRRHRPQDGRLGGDLVHSRPCGRTTLILRCDDRPGNAFDEVLSPVGVPIPRHKPFGRVVVATFDRLNTPVEHRYVWTESRPWFEETGL